MKKRLYFLVPNLELAHQVVDDFHNRGIEDTDIHVVAREGTPLGELPEADLRHHSNILKAAGRGGGSGGAAGLLAGVLALTFPPAGIVIGGGMVAASTILGSGFGVWAASMIGISEPNETVQHFERSIQEGSLLILVDVVKEQRGEIEEQIRKRHPDVKLGNTEATTPNAL